ncbi:hypothetical protein SDC9_186505 [bioreactor metagenome]|uniref:Uncharacterized protein n=1 Tax=bioreactor metagenome TaxID=1076179 RepID=A0A645HJQ3_9ZZZZ
MHPAVNEGFLKILFGKLVQVGNHFHIGGFQQIQFRLGQAIPNADIHINAMVLVRHGILGLL